MTSHEPGLVLGLHPTSRGFGWALFESPGAPLDWGITLVKRGDKNTVSLRHARLLLERYRPETLVLERFDLRTGKRATRMSRLCTAIIELADSFSVSVEIYAAREVKRALGLPEDATRHDMAEVVARHVQAFRHRMPSPRKPWDGADRRLALFCAAALALTCLAEGG